MTQNLHTLGPFVLRSEFPIPELPVAEAWQTPNVMVRYGVVPTSLENAGSKEAVLEVSTREALLRIHGYAKILIRDGREVVIEPEPGALESDIRAYLAAAAFGVLCHQSGMLPLHASAVRSGAGVVAFLGDSGAGKSTLAALLAGRGYPVISDDICLLDPGDPPRSIPLVVPVAPWMKLWRNTVEHLGQSADELPRVFSDDDKYRLDVQTTSERLPLKQIMVLGWLEDPRAPVQAPVQIERLNTLHALQSMLEFVHQPYLLEGMGRTRACFELCARALSGVEAFRLNRPRGFEHVEQVLDALQVHLKQSGLDQQDAGEPGFP